MDPYDISGILAYEVPAQEQLTMNGITYNGAEPVNFTVNLTNCRRHDLTNEDAIYVDARLGSNWVKFQVYKVDLPGFSPPLVGYSITDGYNITYQIRHVQVRSRQGVWNLLCEMNVR